MKTTCVIHEPAKIFHCGLLEIWTKFSVAIDQAMQSVFEIGGVDQVHVYAHRSDSSDLYLENFVFPLNLYCRIKERNVVHARLYLDKETNEAWAWTWLHGYAATREEFRGESDIVIASLSTAILKQLQFRFAFT